MPEDQEGPFRRARRALRHLFGIYRGLKPYSPESCDGCREISQFLRDSKYRGDINYPMYDRLDPDWELGPDDPEITLPPPTSDE